MILYSQENQNFPATELIRASFSFLPKHHFTNLNDVAPGEIVLWMVMTTNQPDAFRSLLKIHKDFAAIGLSQFIKASLKLHVFSLSLLQVSINLPKL